jgi:hypothetical protein
MMAKAEDLASGTFYLTVTQASQNAAAFAFMAILVAYACLLAFKLVKPLDDHEIGLLKAMIPWRAEGIGAHVLNEPFQS